MIKNTCQDCRFSSDYTVRGGGDVGVECHRYPPQAVIDKGAIWPVVPLHQWCGEHEYSKRKAEIRGNK